LPRHSSLVSFELLARPGLRRLAGYRDDALVRRAITGVFDDESGRRRLDGRTNYVRVVASIGADGDVHVRSAGGQGSHQLAGLADANALAVVPDGDGIGPGERVAVLLLGEVGAEPPR
jgi:molybdopterin biosynthesis enzyme